MNDTYAGRAESSLFATVRAESVTLIFDRAAGLVILNRPDLAAYGLVIFLTQMPLVLGGIFAAKKLRAAG